MFVIVFTAKSNRRDDNCSRWLADTSIVNCRKRHFAIQLLATRISTQLGFLKEWLVSFEWQKVPRSIKRNWISNQPNGIQQTAFIHTANKEPKDKNRFNAFSKFITNQIVTDGNGSLNNLDLLGTVKMMRLKLVICTLVLSLFLSTVLVINR